MKNILLICLATLLALCRTPTHRIIENPHIEMANTAMLDISHIELTVTFWLYLLIHCMGVFSNS